MKSCWCTLLTVRLGLGRRRLLWNSLSENSRRRRSLEILCSSGLALRKNPPETGLYPSRVTIRIRSRPSPITEISRSGVSISWKSGPSPRNRNTKAVKPHGCILRVAPHGCTPRVQPARCSPLVTPAGAPHGMFPRVHPVSAPFSSFPFFCVYIGFGCIHHCDPIHLLPACN